MKPIVYRGGIARFKIPSSWVEEYDPAGGATFYEPGETTGTLRLNVLSFERKPESSENPFEGLGYRLFRDDLFIKVEEKNFNEGGESCKLVNWAIGYEVEGSNYRIASFNYTFLERMKETDQTKEESAAIANILNTVEFGREKGASGDYSHKN